MRRAVKTLVTNDGVARVNADYRAISWVKLSDATHVECKVGLSRLWTRRRHAEDTGRATKMNHTGTRLGEQAESISSPTCFHSGDGQRFSPPRRDSDGRALEGVFLREMVDLAFGGDVLIKVVAEATTKARFSVPAFDEAG